MHGKQKNAACAHALAPTSGLQIACCSFEEGAVFSAEFRHADVLCNHVMKLWSFPGFNERCLPHPISSALSISCTIPGEKGKNNTVKNWLFPCLIFHDQPRRELPS
ncbi:hypothetical protein UPYG_G00012930 [Umbra pygmaea]|uniref:Uncharacterized protein n=1 Tax=Umbra pygmaea TaxID=75934 RepID=A0ABD0XIZ5_UMBPY